MATVQAYDVAVVSDHVEIRGVSPDDVVEGLELLNMVRAVQAEHVADNRDELLRALMARKVSLTPPPSLAQAQRLATHRDALLASPVFTYESLQKLRGDASASATRTWVTRRRGKRAVFTLKEGGRTLIPAFQLDDDGEPRAELQPILSTLVEAGIEGWPLWTWLTSPTSFLSGGIPEQVASNAPKRALRAAERFAARPAA